MVILIEDAYYTGSRGYDVGLMKYASPFLLRSRKLHEAEEAERQRIVREAQKLFKKYRIMMVSISREEEILDKVMQLFDNCRL